MEEDGEYDDEDGEYDDEEEEEKSIVKTKPKVANPQKDIKNKDNVKSKQLGAQKVEEKALKDVMNKAIVDRVNQSKIEQKKKQREADDKLIEQQNYQKLKS